MGHALAIATPIASTMAPPRVTTTIEERKLTCRNRCRTWAIANSSIANGAGDDQRATDIGDEEWEGVKQPAEGRGGTGDCSADDA